MEKTYILYDGRARILNIECACELATAETESEAVLEFKNHPEDSIWFEYETKGKNLINGRPRYDLSKMKEI